MQQLIAIRLDPARVLDEFERNQSARNVDYQTLINEALATHVKHVG
jgi:uncharacterized protein (DUF4415 family)